MAASKRRPLWPELPAPVRATIETLVGGRVVHSDNRAGGFSPGFASRLSLAPGDRRVFVKAMDARSWPHEALMYRAEASVAAALPRTRSVPQLLATEDDQEWVILAFEDIDGEQPHQPWVVSDLRRVVTSVTGFTREVSPSPVAVPAEHPRLGGWAGLAADQSRLARLPHHSPWAAAHLPELLAGEEHGLVVAEGDSLLHFDLYPHNILLTPDRVVLVDWPHARLGAPVVDLVLLLSSVAADGLDPEPFLAQGVRSLPAIDSADVTAILAAHAGFLIATGLVPMPPGLEPIAEAKLHLGLGALRWLRRRLG